MIDEMVAGAEAAVVAVKVVAGKGKCQTYDELGGFPSVRKQRDGGVESAGSAVKGHKETISLEHANRVYSA